MNNDLFRVALLSTLLPLTLAGCAVPGNAMTGTPPAASSASPAIASATQPSGAPRAAQARASLAPPSALETQSGIQITQVGLTASGGLVDVRFKILDVAKARALLGSHATMPMLIAGDKPPLMAPHNALQGAKFGEGQILYILYPNLRNAVTPGAEVTVAMGEVRLGPVTAQ